MKILLYGAGAVGSYLGAKLAHAGNEVTLICRKATARAIEELDLTLTRVEGERMRRLFVVKPNLALSLRQAFLNDANYDLMVLGMKSYAIENALNEMSAFCPEPPPMLTIQNGIGVEEQIAAQYPNRQIIAGSFTIPVSMETRSVVLEEKEKGGMGLASFNPGVKISDWAGLLNDAGIQTELLSNYRSMKWSKALLNMLGNASAAILNRHPKALYNHDALYDLEVEMLGEAVSVMKKLNIDVVDLPGYTVKRLAFGVKRMPRIALKPILTKAVTGGRGNKLPSFLLDLNAGKQFNEVYYHNGMVARAGKQVGVSTPVNTTLTKILLGMAQGKVDRERFSGKPGVLLKAVAQYKKQSQ